MQLIFEKDEDAQVVVRLKFGDEEIKFAYVEMIKALIADGKMEDPKLTGEFTPSEVKSINDMVKYLNDELSAEELEKEPVMIGGV